MRIFRSAVEMHTEVGRDLFEMGHRIHPETMQDKDVRSDAGYETIEWLGYVYTLTSKETARQIACALKLDEDYVIREGSERTSGIPMNPGKAWKRREELWTPFIRDGRFAYTYSERFARQLETVAFELMARPNTRQAVVQMFNCHEDHANMGGKDRVPCSMHYQFLMRNGQLDCVYVMRSCDYMTHFPYDVAFAVWLQGWMANRTGAPQGHLVHFIGSLHAYAKDLEGQGIF